jgi:acyl-CoA hydrolase
VVLGKSKGKKLVLASATEDQQFSGGESACHRSSQRFYGHDDRAGIAVAINALGTIFGVVMGWVDIAGAIAAQRYARSPVVTVSIDYMHFIVPIKIGYTVRIRANVTYAGKTSMETEILVDAENTFTGEVRRATSAYLTYVAIDEFGPPAPRSGFPSQYTRRKTQAQSRRETPRAAFSYQQVNCDLRDTCSFSAEKSEWHLLVPAFGEDADGFLFGF